MNKLFPYAAFNGRTSRTARLSLASAALFFLLGSSLYGQINRLQAMGGIEFSAADQDNSLTPFDFAGNPAWLYLDKQETYLDISPSVTNSWGNLRRKYASEGTYDASAAFEGVKTLDSLGTFLGRTSYLYENRRSYYRALKKDPYAGEGFFYTDSTSGDFRYNGPSVQLMYSWELLPRLYAGGAASYGLLEGLKKVYTYAETMYREADLIAGLAYKFSDNFIAGAAAEYFNSQESITSQDINSYWVLVYNYRGEIYSVPLLAESINEKAKKEKIRLGGHIYYKLSPSIQVAARASYANTISKMIMPSGYILAEEGRASFDNIEAQAQARFTVSNNFLAALNFTYKNDQSWSKNSWANLLLWDWETNRTSLGAGLSYKFKFPLFIVFEGELTASSLDSSKYIDSKYVSLTSNDIIVKAGTEYNINRRFILRAGYNRGFYEEELLYGGKDVIYNLYTAGFSFNIFNDVLLDAYIAYSNYSPENKTDVNRSLLGGFIKIRLNSF